jgi:tRNA A-37 threonylcarbamoyl transferase component Bud32
VSALRGLSELAERAWFLLCQVLGRLLSAGRYSKVRIADRHGERQVRKHRVFYAPFLVWLGDPLAGILDTGVLVLPQREWEGRERLIYRSLYGALIQVDGDGALVLPCLRGATLATLLEDRQLMDADRNTAIRLAVVALAEFHRAGFTHGDAMAENVMVDLDAGAAHWLDFETIHDPTRAMAWRRADDVRALLATCLLRTAREELDETLRLILDVYDAEEVARILTTNFTSVWRRPLTFHLGQAPLRFQCFREIARLLRERSRGQPVGKPR